ncbi:response regulator [Erythrobacter sp. BLCC-B19]|uniref:response regulator n=1 Tax=Erythrobacter sp. BLCC-B19 TaxID=3025315 RepID=UPI00235E17B1|nr:response regulator transcription factor [Erythrobacter sp. BLCC-B19]WDA40968.1 response regulator transcription factor [Erythrobacter sp. BLCC-B19]
MSAAPASPIRVLIVDDHPILREGVAAIIELQDDMVVAGNAANGAEAIVQFAALRPDVVLMDLQMPGMAGVEAVEAIRADYPDARIIILTTYTGDAKALAAMRAGASGFLLKSSLRRELLGAIRAVYRGQRHLHADVAQDIALHAIHEQLTAREVEILQLIAGGHPNKQIAWRLGVGEETVKSNIKSIFAKLQVNDRTHAVTTAARRGIIEL